MDLNLKQDFNGQAKRKYNNRKDIGADSLALGKVPPQARELEEAVLGAIMLEKDKLSDVLEILTTEDCFYDDANRKIFAAIRTLPEKGIPVDLLTVAEELRQRGELELIGGPYYLTKLTRNVVSSAHAVAHARIVMQKYIQRELIRISGKTMVDSYEEGSDVFELLDKAETELFEIGNNYLRKNYESIQDILVKTLDEIDKARNRNEDITGVPSGFPSLDKITAGWQKTDLIILAARPSVGKTAFALNLAVNAALNTEKPMGVAIFSLEMSSTQLVKRLLSMVTEVKLESISRGKMEDYEFVQLTQRMDKLEKAPIFLDDQAGLNIFELRAKCRRLKAKHDIQLVVIDYLQLMHGTDKNGNREQEISKISRELKALAKELSIPVIALSQLSRALESRTGPQGKVPQLSDLRESGAIEQDADMVMFIYRPEYHGVENDENGQPVEGETHIRIAKHRNGQLADVQLKAVLEYQKFVELDNREDFGFDNPGAGFNPTNFGGGVGSGNINPGSSFNIQDGAGPAGGNFQTLPSKANNMKWEDDDEFGLKKNPPSTPPPFGKGAPGPDDEDAPF